MCRIPINDKTPAIKYLGVFVDTTSLYFFKSLLIYLFFTLCKKTFFQLWRIYPIQILCNWFNWTTTRLYVARMTFCSLCLNRIFYYKNLIYSWKFLPAKIINKFSFTSKSFFIPLIPFRMSAICNISWFLLTPLIVPLLGNTPLHLV